MHYGHRLHRRPRRDPAGAAALFAGRLRRPVSRWDGDDVDRGGSGGESGCGLAAVWGFPQMRLDLDLEDSLEL